MLFKCRWILKYELLALKWWLIFCRIPLHSPMSEIHVLTCWKLRSVALKCWGCFGPIWTSACSQRCCWRCHGCQHCSPRSAEDCPHSRRTCPRYPWGCQGSRQVCFTLLPAMLLCVSLMISWLPLLSFSVEVCHCYPISVWDVYCCFLHSVFGKGVFFESVWLYHAGVRPICAPLLPTVMSPCMSSWWRPSVLSIRSTW